MGWFPMLFPAGAATSLLLERGSLCCTPNDWPGELSWFGVDGLVFSLFSLPACFPAQPRERLCQGQEQDEDRKDAGEGQGCLF